MTLVSVVPKQACHSPYQAKDCSSRVANNEGVENLIVTYIMSSHFIIRNNLDFALEEALNQPNS